LIPYKKYAMVDSIPFICKGDTFCIALRFKAMKIYSKKIIDTSYYTKTKSIAHDFTNPLFIDIETTGFRRDYDMVYLVGLLYYSDGDLRLTQFLCEKESDEYELLYKLNQMIPDYKTLIHFDGDSFDLPFLKKRMSLYNIKETISSLLSYDFLKELRPYRRLLQTDNLKLKTMEKIAGYDRVDPFTGGDLIQLYQDYLSGNQNLEMSFILHNEEDMIGLYSLNIFLPLIQLRKHLSFSYTKDSSKFQDVHFSTIQEDHSNKHRLKALVHLPWACKQLEGIGHQKKTYSFIFTAQEAVFTFLIQERELKLFFENYMDYYYLTQEDYAIHHSLASFVGSKYKKKATKKTAYVKKSSEFIELPIKKEKLLSLFPENLSIYVFTESYNSTSCYLLKEDFITYGPHILSIFLHDLSNAQTD